MKFLCLAYGNEAAWNTLSPAEQRELLAHDKVIIERGNLVSPVQQHVTSVRNWDGLVLGDQPADGQQLPLAGFSVIEARDLDEVVSLVKDTPCARAGGVIEIRAFSSQVT